MRTAVGLGSACALFLGLAGACSDDGGSGGSGGEGGIGGDTGGKFQVGTDGTGSTTSSGGSTTTGPWSLPDGFTAGDLGGWQVGELIDEDFDPSSLPTGSATDGCGSEIIGVIRDFKRGDQDGGHPDFQTFTGNGETGIVEDDLGDDQKPVYAAGDHQYTTTEANFDQWYRNVDGVNMAYLTTFSFEPNGDVTTFQSSAFFPVDDLGWGNQGHDHNFSFTTEIHTRFLYGGGETFTFTGDDDLWVFINGKLAIDLGGLHPERTDTVDLDDAAGDLGIEVGNEYTLDLFHAERHTSESNFRVDTNLVFTSCGEVIDDVIVK